MPETTTPTRAGRGPSRPSLPLAGALAPAPLPPPARALAPTLALALALIALLPVPAIAEPAAPNPAYVPGEVIVGYHEGEARQGRRALSAAAEVGDREPLPAPRIDLIELAPG